jgi:hypothetical protein
MSDKIETNFSLELLCDVVSVYYDFGERTGKLVMGDQQCCTMDGCIAMFRRIDPDVRLINTYAGKIADTSYMRDMEGRWTAITHVRNPPTRTDFYDIPWKNKTELDPIDKEMGYQRHVSKDGAYRQFLNGKRTKGI